MRDIAGLNRGFIRKYSLLVQNYVNCAVYDKNNAKKTWGKGIY